MRRFFDKRVYLTLMLGITVSGFIIICTLGQSVHRQKVAARTSVSTPKLEQPVCIVREYNGKIGVFKGESSVPYRIIDYDISLLSDFDRTELSKGVVMETDYELRRFIEDIST